MSLRNDLPDCAIATVVDLIGTKWKLLILYYLTQRSWRFNELKRQLTGISQKVLTDTLRTMEASGIVTRTVYDEQPLRVEYSLSELGQSMRPLLREMHRWGIRYQKYQEAKPNGEGEIA